MRRKVLLLDTSIVDEILGVPGKSNERTEILTELDGWAAGGVTLLVSVTALVEAGDHVGNIDEGASRRTCADRLAKLIEATISPTRPWSFEPISWDSDLLESLLQPRYDVLLPLSESLLQKFLQMGDLLIVGEFDRLRQNLDQSVVDVDVWTKDARLRGVVDSLRSSS